MIFSAKINPNKTYSKGRFEFTFTEIIVVFATISLVISAFLPVITNRTKTSQNTWKWAANNSSTCKMSYRNFKTSGENTPMCPIR